VGVHDFSARYQRGNSSGDFYMSYQSRELRSVSSLGQGGVWTYRTEDPIITVTSAGYFQEAAGVLRRGDVIYVTVVTNLNLSSEAFADSGVYAVTDGVVLESIGGGAAYPGHNMVVFDGTNDYMTIGANPFGTTPEYFTAAFYVQPESLAASTNHTLLWANASMVIRISHTTGLMQVLLQNAGGANFNTASYETVPVIAGQPNVIQIAGRSAAAYADSLVSVWVNGALSCSVAGVTGLSGGFTFETYSQWGLFATYGASNKFGAAGGPAGGSAGLAWITAGASAANYIPPSTYDFNNIRDLEAHGSAPGVVPQVYFGGKQTAAHWNAGYNQGSGSDWTMAGDGVA